MIIYLAGPITGVEDYVKQFAEAETELTAQGHTVLNPAMLPVGLGDCDAYMKICMPMIDVAEAIVLLDGWHKSYGARREFGYAMALNKIIVEFNEMGAD